MVRTAKSPKKQKIALPQRSTYAQLMFVHAYAGTCVALEKIVLLHISLWNYTKSWNLVGVCNKYQSRFWECSIFLRGIHFFELWEFIKGNIHALISTSNTIVTFISRNARTSRKISVGYSQGCLCLDPFAQGENLWWCSVCTWCMQKYALLIFGILNDKKHLYMFYIYTRFCVTP